MNFKKILASIAASALALSAMSVAAFAEGKTIKTKLYFSNSADWQTLKSEEVEVSIGGEYSYSITGADYAPGDVKTIYVKDVACEEADPKAEKSDIDAVKVTVTSLKINGADVAVSDEMPTELNEKGVFDFCVYNAWVEDGSANYIELPTENIKSIEMTIKVEAGEGNTDDNNDDNKDDNKDDNNTSDGNNDKQPANTGIEGVAVVAGLAVLATGAIVISKKRK